MKPSISETLRRVAKQAAFGPDANTVDADKDREAVYALADRLDTEGPPRVGDRVEAWALGRTFEFSGILIAKYKDEYGIGIDDGYDGHIRTVNVEGGSYQLRIIARAGYSIEEVNEK